MYESYFGLTEKPFSLNPDPDYLYLGRGHSRALAMLEYGVAQETGMVVITGEVGSGKTTLLRYLLNQLDDSYTVGMITNTHSSFGELIHWISSAFGLKHEGRDKVALYNQFVDFIISEYAAGRRVLVIVDEAQNMTAETLEELRVISNINADKDIVMQLVLVGQPELRDTLATPELRQFVQRISAFYYLKPLEASEITLYIEHRMKKAGCDRKVFDYGAIYLIHEHSAGIPRIINTLCNLGLTYAFGVQSDRVTEEIMREVVEDRAEHGLFGIEHLSLGEDGMRKKSAAKKTATKKAAAKKTTTKKATTKKATTKKATTKKTTTKKATSKKATSQNTAAGVGTDNDIPSATELAEAPHENAAAQTLGDAGTQNQDLFSASETDKAEGTGRATSQAGAGATQAEVTAKPNIAAGQPDTSRIAEGTAAAAKDPSVVKEIVEASMFDVTSEFDRLPDLVAASTDCKEADAAGEAPMFADNAASTETSDFDGEKAAAGAVQACAGGTTQAATEGSEDTKSDAGDALGTEVKTDADEPSDTDTKTTAGADADGELSADPKTNADDASGSASKPESDTDTDTRGKQPSRAASENDIHSIERLFSSATNRSDVSPDMSPDADAAKADAAKADAAAAKTGSPVEGEISELAGSTAKPVESESVAGAAGSAQDQAPPDAPVEPKTAKTAGEAPKLDESSGSSARKDAGLDAILAAVEGVLADHERRDAGAAPRASAESDSMPHKRPLAEAISDAVRSSTQAASGGTGAGSASSDVAGAGDTHTATPVDGSAAGPAEVTPAPRLVPRIEVNVNEELDRPRGLMGRLRSFFNGS